MIEEGDGEYGWSRWRTLVSSTVKGTSKLLGYRQICTSGNSVFLLFSQRYFFVYSVKIRLKKCQSSVSEIILPPIFLFLSV